MWGAPHRQLTEKLVLLFYSKMSEKDQDSALEIYVRFNDDMEKDYCFQVSTTTAFRDLLKIFDTLPISLRPNIFYDPRPIGFQVSTAPGYLTEDGALLFSYETSQKKYIKNVKLDETVAKNCWPGQLVLPVWEFNSFAYYSFCSFLLVWLYTDLPDFVSPTPGICLTNQLSRLAAMLAMYFGYPRIAEIVISDVQEPAMIGAQCVFFVFHILKTLAIFFVIYTGMFNPARVFRFGKKETKEVTKDVLIELGWTGSKRANADEYKDFYREYKIKELGGMVPAHQAGLFQKLKKLGVFLGDGEGFNTPISAKNKFSDIGEKKFVLSYEYFVKLGEFFEGHTQDKEAAGLNDAIKQFRRYGLLHSDAEISEIVSKRKEEGDSKLE